jgi:hypothetical protein
VGGLQELELRRVVGLAVLGQAEAERPELGVRVGEQAVQRLVEDRRNQLPHDLGSMFWGRVGAGWSRRVVAA